MDARLNPSRTTSWVTLYSQLGLCVLLGLALTGCVATGTQRAPGGTTVGETFDDSVVTAKVKAALIGDPVTKARQISVETLHGVVQLLGFVDSEAERAQATVVTKGVAGVQEVRNNLAVKQNR